MKKIAILLTTFALAMAPVVAENGGTASESPDSSVIKVETRVSAEPAKAEPRQISASMVADLGETVLIPVVAISMPFICTILVVFFVFYYKEKEKKARYAVMTKAIEAGRELPADFFDSPAKKHPKSELRHGIMSLSVGVGLFGMMYLWPGLRNIAPVCLIPICIGLGQLLAWKLEQRSEKKKEPEIENENRLMEN